MDTQPSGPVTPAGVNHIVFNVHDLEESHHFWSDLLGFEQVGELHHDEVKMRFYSGSEHHHDLALVESDALNEPERWQMFGGSSAVNHIAITYPNQTAWKQQVEWLRSQGVDVNVRLDHGMTHSVYINDPNGYGVEVLYDLPREVWEHDVDGALNYAVKLPSDDAHLTDESEYVTDFHP